MMVYRPVTCIGRQPNSDVWVLNKDLQLDKYGVRIPLEQQEFVYEDSLINKVDMPCALKTIVPANGVTAIKDLCQAMEVLLPPNFLSSLMVLGGMAAMAVHYESILKYRKACPMVMAVGPTKCGKTTALNCAAAIVGSKIWGTGTTFSLPAAMEQANGSTMGYCLDDVKDDKIVEEVVIATYNQGGYVNLGSGRKIPKCAPVLTSNWAPKESRIMSRLAVIPFHPINAPLRGMERMMAEQQLCDAMENAGQGIGVVIRIGELYHLPSSKEKIYSELAEFVMKKIGDEFTRESVNYAELIGFTTLLCSEIGGPSEDELKNHFRQTIAPSYIAEKTTVNKSHVLVTIAKMCSDIPDKMILCINPNIQCSQTKLNCIAISIPSLVEASKQHNSLTADQIKSGTQAFQCTGFGCKKAHQANFLMKNATLPETGIVQFKVKGDEKNSSGRWAILIKRSAFTKEDLKAIDSVFEPSSWRTTEEEAETENMLPPEKIQKLE